MSLRKIHSKMVDLDLSFLDDMRDDVAWLQGRLEQLQRDLEGVSQSQLEIINSRIEELRSQLEANKYTHPDTHPATMIVQDENHRFTNDEEKNGWNKAKSDVVTIQSNIVTIENRLTALEQSEGENGGGNIEPLIREVANLKLKQEASDRIEGGILLGDDMNGNTFGMELNMQKSNNFIFNESKLLMYKGESVYSGLQPQLVDINSSNPSMGHTTNIPVNSKLLITDNGEIYTVLSASGSQISIRKSVDNGVTWEIIDVPFSFTTLGGVGMKDCGSFIYIILSYNNTSMSILTYNYLNNSWLEPILLTNQMTSAGLCDIEIDVINRKIHVVSLGALTKSYSQVIYAEGNIGYDGRATFSSAYSLTSNSTNYYTPTIVLDDLYSPVVFCRAAKDVCCIHKTNNAWISSPKVVRTHTYNVISLDAIFVPKSINGLNRGRIWLVYRANESSSVYQTINFLYSDTGGETWSSYSYTPGVNNTNQNPVITATKDNSVYIIFSRTSGTIKYKINSGLTTGSENIADSTFKPDTIYAVKNFKIDTNEPIYLGVQGTNSTMKFVGKWTKPSATPQTSSTVVYNASSTDYIGMFVKKVGDISITAYANNLEMDSELIDDEYKFTKSLAVKEPVEIRLELSRPSISNGENDSITRIIGGKA